jgi:outer membrane protein TolC
VAAANNRQVKIDDLEIKAKESALEKVKENAAMTGEAYGTESVLNNRIRKEVSPMEALAALEFAKMSKQKHSDQLELDIKKSFLDILLTQKELEIENKKLENAKLRLDITKARYSANSITKQDVDLVQYELSTKTNYVESLQDKLKTLDIKLKEQMGLPLEGDLLILEGVIEQESFREVDINKVAKMDMEKDPDVYLAAQNYYAANKTMELTKALFKSGSNTYDNNIVALEKASRDYEAAKVNRETAIRNGYNELLNLKDNVQLSLMYEDLQKKILDNTKIKYDKGLLSREELIASEEKYLDAVLSKYKAICDFNIKNGEFLNLISKR